MDSIYNGYYIFCCTFHTMESIGSMVAGLVVVEVNIMWVLVRVVFKYEYGYDVGDVIVV